MRKALSRLLLSAALGPRRLGALGRQHRKPSMVWHMAWTYALSLFVFCAVAVGNMAWLTHGEDAEFDRKLQLGAQLLSEIHETELSSEGREAALRGLERFIALTVGADIRQPLLEGERPASEQSWAMRVYTSSGQTSYSNQAYRNRVQSLHQRPELQAEAGYFDWREGDVQWRGYRAKAASGVYTTEVLQTRESRWQHTRAVTQLFILTPLMAFLPLALLAIWFASRRSLEPLLTLASRIAKRSPNDLTPIVNNQPFAETTPLVDELNALLAKLSSTLQRERSFLADAAHELRTPLAVIQAQVHVLTQAENDEERNNAAAELSAGIERAASLIQKLLLTARYSTDGFEPHFEAVDLSAFVQERIVSMSVLAAKKCIELSLEAPSACLVRMDRPSFVSAVDNVLDNAIRYSPEGSEIQVSIERVSPTQVRLRVADQGRGIPPELRQRVFERFYRVAGTEAIGSGLGLAIVKRVMQLHGGSVSLAHGIQARGLAVEMWVPVD